MKKIAFVGGGSGGHITPGVALYAELSLRGERDFIWIGEPDSMEEAEAKKIGVPFFGITAGKVPRYFSLSSLFVPLRLIEGTIAAYMILKAERPDSIFSKGSAVSIPVGVAAFLLGIPLAVHESDTVSGISNRVTGLFARRVFLGFERAKKYFSQSKVEAVGQILHPHLQKTARAARATKRSTNEVLVQCGSLGSATVFNALIEALPSLGEFHFTIVLGTLNTGFRSKFEKFKNVTALDWADSQMMAELYSKSDFAIARAGATSIAELQEFGVRSIFIPYSYSAGNHQYFNAVEWCEKYPENILLEESRIAELSQTLMLLRDQRDEKSSHRSSAKKENITTTALDRIVEYLLTNK